MALGYFGRGDRECGMPDTGPVRKTQAKSRREGNKQGATGEKGTAQPQKGVTTFGYVDIWAGVTLTHKQFLLLARQVFFQQSPEHEESEPGGGGGAVSGVGCSGEWASRLSPSGAGARGARN